MAKKKPKAFVIPDRPPKFKVGDRVEYFFYTGWGIVGEIIEDRGPVGWSGVHYYYIRPLSEYAGTEPVYQSEEHIRPAQATPTSAK